jgi:hypothetical protein
MIILLLTTFIIHVYIISTGFTFELVSRSLFATVINYCSCCFSSCYWPIKVLLVVFCLLIIEPGALNSWLYYSRLSSPRIFLLLPTLLTLSLGSIVIFLDLLESLD